MKKILFLNTTKLAVLSAMLLLAVFCTIGMSFTPAEEGENVGNPNDSTYVTGPRRSHWKTTTNNGCGGTTTLYHHKTDYARVEARIQVHDNNGDDITSDILQNNNATGEVKLSFNNNSENHKGRGEGGGIIDNTEDNYDETNQSTSFGTAVYLNWKCGIDNNEDGSNSKPNPDIDKAHSLEVTLTAKHWPNSDYIFAGWYLESNNKALASEKDTALTQIITLGNGSGYTEYHSGNEPRPTTYEQKRDTVKYYALYKPAPSIEVSLIPSENGSYTYKIGEEDDILVSEESTISVKGAFTLKATPDEKYKFFGWYELIDEDGEKKEKYFSYNTITTATFLENTTICAKFIPKDWATYIVKGEDKRYFEFDKAEEAAASSSSTVFLPITDGIVPYKEGGYSIRSGVTLLIPYEGTYKPVKKNVEYAIDATFSSANCTTYVVLTLAKGTTITVKGNIEVAAKLVSKGQSSTINSGNNGAIYQTYGEIIMSAGSRINLENGAYLYAWGRITGSEYSKINAYEGSTVYESFQITDFQGGTRTKAMYQDRTTYKIFPFSQYYIQNIETPIRFEYGSKEYTNAMLTVQSTTEAPIKDLPIIGKRGALFNINSKDSYVEKRYDAINDRQVYKIGGTTSVDDFNTSIKILTDLDINTKDYLLPFTNNIVAHIESGELTINANLIMNADNKIVVADGAKIKITAQKNLFVYDQDDWKTGFVFANPPNTAVAPLCYTIPYATTTGKPATVSGGKFTANPPIRTTVEDATLQVDGELIVNGNLYVSPGLANICSTGAGKVTFPNGNTCSETYIVHHLNTVTETSNIMYARIAETYVTSFIPAWLHNGKEWYEGKDGDFKKEYLETAGVSESTTIQYANNHWGWMEIWKDHDGRILKISNTCTQTNDPSKYPLNVPEGYTFIGWNTEVNNINQEVIHTAQYTFVDIVDADNTEKTLTINANGWASSGWPYTINGTPYEKTARQPDRTLVIPYDGNPNDDMAIEVKNYSDKVISNHSYKVPFVYDSNTTMSGTDEKSIVFVKSGTLQTTDGAKAKEIYVADSAELKVNGTLTVGKLVLRTTPYKAAVLTIENGGAIADGGQVYYSRITRDQGFHLFAIPAGSNTANVVLSDGTSAAVDSKVAPYGAAWQLREYNTARRAEKGADGANWDNIGINGDGKTYSDVAIEASKGYELRSGSKYYREYLFPVTLPTTATSVQVTAATGAAGAAHAGWNILCSPYTGIYTVENYNDPASAIKLCWWQQKNGSYIQELPKQIKPAVPFAYQASQTGTLAFDTNFTFAASAPRKQSAAEALTETEWVHLDIFDAYGEGDETSLFVHPTRFAQTYKTGIDVAKQSLTAARPIIYSTHAYGDMAFAGIADSLLENGIDIAVYSPAAQELTFSLRENKFLHRLEYLCLADNETGARTDLLMDDYTCHANAGTAKGRFVLNGRFKAPQIATGIGNTQTDYNIYAIGNNIAISGVEQGTPIYVFDAVGHMIYTTAATSDEVIVPAPCAGVYMLTIGGQTAKLVVNK